MPYFSQRYGIISKKRKEDDKIRIIKPTNLCKAFCCGIYFGIEKT